MKLTMSIFFKVMLQMNMKNQN